MTREVKQELAKSIRNKQTAGKRKGVKKDDDPPKRGIFIHQNKRATASIKRDNPA